MSERDRPEPPDPGSHGWHGRGLAVVASTYLAQGIVAAVGLMMLGTLAQRGTPLEDQVGIFAGGMIPWALKFVVALLLDLGPSWPLRVRGLILAALGLCGGACLWALAGAWASVEAGTPGALQTLGLGWLALNLAGALQDVIVDGLALDLLRARRAFTATAMGLGHAIGIGLGPMLLGSRIVAIGMTDALREPAWVVAGLAAVPLAALWIPGRPTRARAQAPARRERSPGDVARLAWIPVLFFALTYAGNVTTAVGFEFLFGHLQLDPGDYTTILIPIAALAGVIGALGMGPVVARLGAARASMIAVAGLGLAWLGFAALAGVWDRVAVIAVLAGCEGLLQPAMIVGLHALALLAAARSPLPTTGFVLAMAALNLPRVLAPLSAPAFAELGWVGLFVACGLLQLAAGVGLWPLRTWTAEPTAAEPAQTQAT